MPNRSIANNYFTYAIIWHIATIPLQYVNLNSKHYENH